MRQWLGDAGDWFSFEVGTVRPVDVGIRLPTTAHVGPTVWTQFHVDLVGTDLRMTGEPEHVPPLRVSNARRRAARLSRLSASGPRRRQGRRHLHRYGEQRLVSTRYKDLIDLVSIARGASIAADRQRVALASESERRGVTLPARFDVPDRALWEPGYAAEAKRSVMPMPTTLDDALAVVGPFLDPLLDGTTMGTWQPDAGWWT